jgi:ribose-phosphate pyrophosphokinase
VAVGNIVGNVLGRRPILVDDMIATGGTIAAAFDAVVAAGASPSAVVVATHGVFAGGWEELFVSRSISRVLVTDSVEPVVAPRQLQVERVSLAPLLVEALERIEQQRPLDGLLAST